MGYLTSSITTLCCQAFYQFLTTLPASPTIATYCRYLCYRRESSSDYSDYSDDEFSSDEEEQEDPKDYRPGGGGGVQAREETLVCIFLWLLPKLLAVIVYVVKQHAEHLCNL